MHHERTGRGAEIREVHDVNQCAGCQGLLAAPHTTMGWLQCSCAGTAGHRTWWCFDCRTMTYDPPHDPKRGVVVGGAGTFAG